LEKVAVFEDYTSNLTEEGRSVVRNVAEVIDEYPELQVMAEGHVSGPEMWRKKSEVAVLSRARAAVAAEALRAAGVLNDVAPVARGNEDALTACCRFRVRLGPLLPPQRRVDLITQRFGLDFPRQGAELSQQGCRVLNALASLVREAGSGATLVVPRQSSTLAWKRAELIVRTLREVLMEQNAGPEACVELQTAPEGSRIGMFAELVLHDGQTEAQAVPLEQQLMMGERDPQEKLCEILADTPLAFGSTSGALLPEVFPVIRQLASVLRTVDRHTCLIEAYSGPKSARSKGTMQERAKHLAIALAEEGVHIPLIAKGHCAGYVAAGTSAAGPCIVLTLVSDDAIGDLEANDDFMCGLPPNEALGCRFTPPDRLLP